MGEEAHPQFWRAGMAPSQMQPKRAPKLELRTMTPDYCEFVLSDTDVSVANVLRRIIISHVPTIAVGGS